MQGLRNRTCIATCLLTVTLFSRCIAAAVDMPGGAPCAIEKFDHSAYTVCIFDSTKEEFRLALRDPSGVPFHSFDKLAVFLGPAAHRVRFAMNAGIFDPRTQPDGLYVEDSKVLTPINIADGSGNFFTKPNGVFSVDSKGIVRVETTPEYISRRASPVWATQSGPMLVSGGMINGALGEKSHSLYVRNGVAVLGPHKAVFAISQRPVSLLAFARFFRDGVKSNDALYLDGSISSLWEPATGRKDAADSLGPMLIVLSRKSGA